MANPFSLEGKNAWITGASYGIGFNIAKAFVGAGIKTIIFNDINEAALERGLANYKEAGITNVKGYVCDVTDENAVKALVDKIHEEVGQIDILVNNAGIIKRIPMHEMKRAEFQQVIDVDLVAPYICSAAVVPEMMERREGKIINICSMMSELGRETVSAYAAAKCHRAWDDKGCQFGAKESIHIHGFQSLGQVDAGEGALFQRTIRNGLERIG